MRLNAVLHGKALLLFAAGVMACLTGTNATGMPLGSDNREGSKSDIKKISKEVIQYLSTDDKGKREKCVTKIIRYGKGKSFSTYEKAVVDSFYSGQKFKKGWIEVKMGSELLGISIPASYDHGTPIPLVVGLHHGAMGEPWKEMGNFLASTLKARKYLGVFPIHPKCTWTNESAAQFIIDAVDYMIANYNVDPDRVYLLGFDFGANGAWYMACHRPSRFAAIAALAGCYKNDYLSNAANIPIFAAAGEKDTATKPEEIKEAAKKVNDMGGQVETLIVPGCADKGGLRAAMLGSSVTKPVFDFFDKHTRDQFPKKLKFKIPARGDAIVYYIGVGSQSKGSIEAEIVAGNRIEIKAESVESLTVLLRDVHFDFEKPIEVFVNGERRFYEKKAPELDFLLACRESWGRAFCFANKIDLTDLKQEKAAPKKKKKKKTDKQEAEPAGKGGK